MIELAGVHKSFDSLEALHDISFRTHTGAFVAVVGPSGSGKSTLLRLLAGLEKPTQGEIRVAGELVTAPGPERCLVFQDNALYPWRTVYQNVAYGLEIQHLPKEQIADRVGVWLDKVGLTEFQSYYPRQLSGGMQQRVALARALVLNPPVLLMDEPFGALDAMTRMEMQLELLRLWEQSKSTVVLITHDVEEALFLADTVLVLTPRPGRVALELSISEPRPRDRGAAELALIRRKIFTCIGFNYTRDRGEGIDYAGL